MTVSNTPAQFDPELYYTFFKHSLTGFALHEIICDEQGQPIDYRFLDVNPAFESLTGLRRETILGKRVLAVLPDTEHSWIERYGKVALSGEPVTFEDYSQALDKHFQVSVFCPEKGKFGVTFIENTAQKQTEARLRKAEYNYRILADHAYDLETWENPNGKFNYISPSAERITGYAAPEFLKNPALFSDLIIPEDRYEWHGHRHNEPPSESSLRQGVQFRIKHRNGQIRWLEHHCVPIYNTQNGAFLGYRSSNRDVTDRKTAQLWLAYSNQALEASLNAIALADLSGKLTYVNASFLHMWRIFEPEHALGREAIAFWEDESEAQAVVNALQNVGFWQGEMVARRDDGSTFYAQLSASLILDNEDKPSGMMASFADISKQHTAQLKLEEQAQRLKLATKAAGLGIWDLDLKTNDLIWDERMYELYGVAPDEFGGIYQTWQQSVHPEDLEAAEKAVQESAISAKSFYNQFRIVRFNGEIRHIEALANVLTDENGEAYRMIGVNWDITDRVKMSEENVRLQTQFYQAQKMESIGKLAGGIAHDFNNLLVPIIGYAELGMLALEEKNKRYEQLLEIKKAAQRAASLTRQILAFSRQQVLEMKRVDINAVVSDFEKMLRRLIGENITLLTHLSPTIKKVKADAGQLEQVLLNLVVNARDAMPTGGMLTIETTNVHFDTEHRLMYPDIEEGHYACFSVSDTGCGMDEQTREKIFEPFFTTKQRGEGTGLGLATVFGIIKQHNGHIHVFSEVGNGSSFKVYLPALIEKNLEDEAAIRKRELVTGHEKILVVEDDPNVRKLVTHTLKSNGYEVLEAVDGQTAFDIAQDHGETIDLLLTDVVMPDLNGREVFERLSRTYPSLSVLYMSGYTDEIISQYGIMGEDLDFLQKPFTIRDLLGKLREALSKKKS